MMYGTKPPVVSSDHHLRVLDDKLARSFGVVVALAAAGVALTVSENYVLWSHSGEPDATCELLKLLSSFLTLWLLVFLWIYYRRKFEQMKLVNTLLPQDTLASSGLIWSVRGWSFVPEALLCLVHAPPFLSVEIDTSYYDLHSEAHLPTVLSSDELCAVVMMLARSALLIRWLPYLSGLASRGSRLYANLNNLNVTTSLSLRLALRRNPAILLSVATTLMLFMLAFSMQVAERRVNRKLDEFGNCVWLVLVSMSGVGFGDVVPQTALGRLVSSIATAWGAVTAMLTVLATMRGTALNKSEARVDQFLELTRNRRRLKQRAAFYIQAAWGTYLERLQRSQSAVYSTSLLGREPLHTDPKFCRAMRGFRTLRKALSTPDDDMQLIFKELLDSRTRVEGRLRDVEEKLDEMDAKFEHNIAAMNELLQKNLKYLKHVAS